MFLTSITRLSPYLSTSSRRLGRPASRYDNGADVRGKRLVVELCTSDCRVEEREGIYTYSMSTETAGDKVETTLSNHKCELQRLLIQRLGLVRTSVGSSH